MIASLNQAVVPLTVFALTPAGAIKTNVTSGTVRVYSIDAGGNETNILNATALVEVSSGRWRYTWEPATFPVGEYIAEYYMIDDDTIQTRVAEDVIVRDIADNTDLEVVKQISEGRQHTANDQLLFYAADKTTVTHRFNLFDKDGNPAVENVADRVPVP